MKIVYFSYLYDIKGVSAGSANKAIGFIGALRSIGHDVAIYWRSIQPEYFMGVSTWLKFRYALKKRLSRWIHDTKKLLTNIKWGIQEYGILKREKPDILFLRSELYNFSASLLAMWFGIPVVLEADCPTAYEHRYMSGRDKLKLPFLPEWIEQWNWKSSRAIIVISEILKSYLIENGVPRSKVTVIPNGADTEKFKPGIGGKSLRRQFNAENRVVVGWAGSLYGWSGLGNLLDMTRKILRMRNNVVFLFVGGGRNRQVIESTFDPKDLDKRVFVTGTIPYDQVPKYVDAMDIVVVPYPKLDFWYPSSMKLFEYMASQKAIVASSVPQVSDVIQDGKNGLLFEPDNLEEFISKMLKLIDNPVLCSALARQARQSVLNNYTWEKHAKKMADIFYQVLN